MSANPNNVNTPARVDMRAVEASWSLLDVRKGRDDEGRNENSKVRSLNGNTRALRGGDWIATRHEAVMTLAVAWTLSNGKQYGLTVAHAFTDDYLSYGDSVFAFNSDEACVKTLDGKKSHKHIKIGTVVAVDREQTDSVIIEIFPSILIDPLAVALSGGDDHVCKIALPKPGDTATNPKPPGQRLVMYGAARRGMIGVRVPASDDVGDEYKSSCIATKSYETTDEGGLIATGATKLTFKGDCGALYIDEDNFAVCMHTTIEGLPKINPTAWTSRGSLLQHIANRHALFFGGNPDSPSLNRSTQSSQVSIALEKIIVPKTENYPRLDFSQNVNSDIFFEKQPALRFSDRLRLDIPDEDEDNDADDNNTVTENEEKKRED